MKKVALYVMVVSAMVAGTTFALRAIYTTNCYTVLLSDGTLCHAHGHHIQLRGSYVVVYSSRDEQQGGAIFRNVMTYTRNHRCTNGRS